MLSRSGHEILTHPNFVCKVLHSTSYTWCIWCAQQTFLSARNWWRVDSSDLLVHMWSTQWWDLWWVCLGLSTSIIFIYFPGFQLYNYIYLRNHIKTTCWKCLAAAASTFLLANIHDPKMWMAGALSAFEGSRSGGPECHWILDDSGHFWRLPHK